MGQHSVCSLSFFLCPLVAASVPVCQSFFQTSEQSSFFSAKKKIFFWTRQTAWAINRTRSVKLFWISVFGKLPPRVLGRILGQNFCLGRFSVPKLLVHSQEFVSIVSWVFRRQWPPTQDGVQDTRQKVEGPYFRISGLGVGDCIISQSISAYFLYIAGSAYPWVSVSPCRWPIGCSKGLAGGVTGYAQQGAARSQSAIV